MKPPDPEPYAWCPTCGVSGQDECHTASGRDHPARTKRRAATRPSVQEDS